MSLARTVPRRISLQGWNSAGARSIHTGGRNDAGEDVRGSEIGATEAGSRRALGYPVAFRGSPTRADPRPRLSRAAPPPTDAGLVGGDQRPLVEPDRRAPVPEVNLV